MLLQSIREFSFFLQPWARCFDRGKPTFITAARPLSVGCYSKQLDLITSECQPSKMIVLSPRRPQNFRKGVHSFSFSMLISPNELQYKSICTVACRVTTMLTKKYLEATCDQVAFGCELTGSILTCCFPTTVFYTPSSPQAINGFKIKRK